MTANDTFEGSTLQPWWRLINDDTLVSPPSVSNGYSTHALQTGGPSGSFHFLDNRGYQCMQAFIGDGFWAADVQCLNSAETDIPPAGGLNGPPRAFGLACHNFATLEFNGDSGRDYWHIIITCQGPQGGSISPNNSTSLARMVTETKVTTNSVTQFNTYDGLELREASDFGSPAEADELMGRWWVALEIVGNECTFYHAAVRQPTSRVPRIDEFTQLDASIENLQIRPYRLIGLVAYSSVVSPNVTGRCRQFVKLA